MSLFCRYDQKNLKRKAIEEPLLTEIKKLKIELQKKNDELQKKNDELQKKNDTINNLNAQVIKFTASTTEQKDINLKLEEEIKVLKRNRLIEKCEESRKISTLNKTIAKQEKNKDRNFKAKMENALIKQGWTEGRARLAANPNLKYIRKRDLREKIELLVEHSKGAGSLKQARAFSS